MICDGATPDEARQSIHDAVVKWGWSLMTVQADPPDESWTYTIGLTAFDHPEVVIVSVGQETAGALLDALGERVRHGDRFDTATGTVVDGAPVGLLPVHPVHVERGLLDAWIDYYQGFGEGEPEPRAIQVIVPDWFFCADHAASQPILASPDAQMRSLGVTPPE